MDVPYAVVCHIAEKNSTIEELNQLIELLQNEHNFILIGGPSYDGEKTHMGTTLVKNISGDSIDAIFEAAKEELEEIEIGVMASFACRLTVVAIESKSGGVFIN